MSVHSWHEWVLLGNRILRMLLRHVSALGDCVLWQLHPDVAHAEHSTGHLSPASSASSPGMGVQALKPLETPTPTSLCTSRMEYGCACIFPSMGMRAGPPLKGSLCLKKGVLLGCSSLRSPGKGRFSSRSSCIEDGEHTSLRNIANAAECCQPCLCCLVGLCCCSLNVDHWLCLRNTYISLYVF